MCQLILQDRHVTYRGIETTLGVSGISLYSILHEHLTVKQISSRWIPHNLSINQVINHGFTRLSPKVNSSRLLWVFQDEPNPKKIVRALNTSKQMIAYFFGKNGHVAIVPLEQHRTVNCEWYKTMCLPVASKKSEKPTTEDGFLFTMTMRVVTYCLK